MSKQSDLEFLLFTSPGEARSTQTRKIVRSHVTRLQHRRAKLRNAAAFSETADSPSHTNETSRSTKRHRLTLDTSRPIREAGHISTHSSPHSANDCAACSLNMLSTSTLAHAISTGTLSYRTYAMQDEDNVLGDNLKALELDLSSTMAYYRAMVLTQSNDLNDRFRRDRHSEWESFIHQDPVLLTMAILVAVRLQVCISGRSTSKREKIHMLVIEQFQLQRINHALADPRRALSDHILITIALVSSYEAKHGVSARSRTHLDGLVRILALRGGLPSVGESNPYTERVLMWMLTNVMGIVGSHAGIENALASSRLARISPDSEVFRAHMVTS